MKKTLVALAALAATASFAQSSVTLSGNLDLAYGSATAGTTDGKTTISTRDITASTSVINIIAVEDLGGGTKATVKYGLDPRKLVRENAAFASDESFIGLEGAAGNIRLGQPNSIGLTTHLTSTPFGTGIGSGYSHNIVGHASNIRYARSVRYDSPNISGFTVSVLKAQGSDAAVAATSVATANDIIVAAGDRTELGLRYANGPLNVAVAQVKMAAYAAEKERTANTLAANYALGAATLYVGATSGDLLSDTTAAKTQNGSNVAVKYNMGKIDVLAGYGRRQDTGSDAQTITSLRGDYSFSKTTIAYVGYEDFKGATEAANQKLMSVGLRKSF
jgi:predicted porin